MTNIIKNAGVVAIKDVLNYVDALCARSKISPENHEVVINQLKQLEGIYGNHIQKDQVLKIISTQLEMIRTGYFQEPVHILEFLESPQYMNQKRFLRPVIKKHLLELWDDPGKYIQVVLGGGIGIGKNYFLDMSYAYIVYRLSCMYSPQAHFGLAPGSDIVLLFQSRTYDAARKIVFSQFKQRVEASEYFCNNFMFAKRTVAELHFPNNIIVKPVSSSDTAALSMNCLIACFPGEQEYLMEDGELRSMGSRVTDNKKLMALDDKNNIVPSEYEGNVYTGRHPVYKLHFENGDSIECSPDQRFKLFSGGFVQAKDAEDSYVKYVKLYKDIICVHKLKCLRAQNCTKIIHMFDPLNAKVNNTVLVKTQTGFLQAHNCIDEANFLSVVKRKNSSANGPGKEIYDQAQKLYETVYDRIESRYRTTTGMLGKVFLLSSANYEDDFIDRLEKEAKTDKTIFVMHLSQWESRPDKFSRNMFYIKLPTAMESTRLQDEKPANMEGWIEVPENVKSKFERSPEESLRSIAGIPIVSRHKFIRMSYLNTSINNYAKIYGSKKIGLFNKEDIIINNVDKVSTLFNLDFVQMVRNSGPFSVHIDLGLNTDAAGIGVSHVIGGKAIGSDTDVERLPIFGVPGILCVKPPANQTEDIDINKIKELILMLGELIDIESITMDQFQSAALIQAFRKKGFSSIKVPLDKLLEPYIDFKQALVDERVYLMHNTVLMEEYKNLEQNEITGKVDHTNTSSKDVADGVTGSVYTLMQKKSTYILMNRELPKYVHASKLSKYKGEVPGSPDFTESPRGSLNRKNRGRSKRSALYR